MIKVISTKLVQNEGYIEISVLDWIKSFCFYVLAKQVVSKFKVKLQMAFELYTILFSWEVEERKCQILTGFDGKVLKTSVIKTFISSIETHELLVIEGGKPSLEI